MHTDYGLRTALFKTNPEILDYPIKTVVLNSQINRNDGPPEKKQLIIDISKENTNIDNAIDLFIGNARQVFSPYTEKNVLGALEPLFLTQKLLQKYSSL